jgi:hypothetical protein
VVEIPTKTVSALKVIKTERAAIFGDVVAVKIALCTAFKPYDDIKDLTELPEPNSYTCSQIFYISPFPSRRVLPKGCLQLVRSFGCVYPFESMLFKALDLHT